MRLPRQSVWPIFPGVSSFLNYEVIVSFMVGKCSFLAGRRYLWGYIDCSVWDVEVPNDEDEAGGHYCGGVIIEGSRELEVCS